MTTEKDGHTESAANSEEPTSPSLPPENGTVTEPEGAPEAATAPDESSTAPETLAENDSFASSALKMMGDVRAMRIAIIIIGLGATIWILDFARVILIPIVLAFFLSYVLTPFVNVLMKLRIPGTRLNMPRGLAALIVVVFSVFMGGLLGTFIGDQIRGLAMELPKYEEQLVENVTSLRETVIDIQMRAESFLEPMRREGEGIAPIDELSDAPDDTAERIQVFLEQGGGDFWSTTSGFIAGGLTGILGFVAQTIMCIFLLVFILAQGPALHARFIDAAGTGARRRRAMEMILGNVNDDVQRYLFNRFATNTVVALLVGTLFYLYGLDFAFLLGIFAGLFNFIPYVGPIIGTIFPATIAYMQFGEWQAVLWVVLIYASVTGLEGNLVTPYVIGRHLKINSLAVLLSAIFWGWMWGAIGLLLAIPIVATMKSISENVDGLRPLASFLRG